MPDGSIVFSTELDNKELNRQLQKSKKEIEKLGQTIEEQEAKKSSACAASARAGATC